MLNIVVPELFNVVTYLPWNRPSWSAPSGRIGGVKTANSSGIVAAIARPSWKRDLTPTAFARSPSLITQYSVVLVKWVLVRPPLSRGWPASEILAFHYGYVS